MEYLRNRTALRRAAITVLALACLATPAMAQEGEEDVSALIERGQVSYRAHCASCHGAAGLGDGVVAQYLTVAPTNLTQLAVGGEFQFDDVYDAIDGRAVPGHGTREMPVWGPALTEMDGAADKKVVKERIVEIVYFLKSMQ